jgi:LPS export ABC transporter protein LptC
MKTAPLFLSSFLLGLIIAGVYLLAHNPVSSRFPPLVIPQDTATSSMEEVKILRFNPAGQRQEFFSMAAWRYYPVTETTVIDNPELLLYKNNLAIWKIAAAEGIGYHSDTHRISMITLQNNVHLLRLSELETPFWKLETEVLHLSPKEAQTDALVTLNGPGKTMIKTQGAWADLVTGDIKLLHNVKGKYDLEAF